MSLQMILIDILISNLCAVLSSVSFSTCFATVKFMYVIEQDTRLSAACENSTCCFFHSEVQPRHVPNDAHRL